MRAQERVTRGVVRDGSERAGRLSLGGDRLVPDSTRGELDPIPCQHICRDELGELRRRTMTQITHDGDLRNSPHEPTRGAHVAVAEPGHSRHL